MRKNLNRTSFSMISTFTFLAFFGAFFLLPIIYSVVTAFKPLNEIFIFPPKLFVENPTVLNFVRLFRVMNDFFIPFSRYLFNSILVSFIGTAGHILFASMAAFPMAKHRFYGKVIINKVIILSLLFTASVTYIPQYVVLARTGLLNSYLAVILPAMQGSLGLYLMMNFMHTLPDEMLEASRIDGASEISTFFRIAMPNVRPAWLTMMIFAFQGLWNSSGGGFIYSEEFKMLPNVLSAISAGGMVRAGAVAAAALILMIPPILLFTFSQSRIIETMSTSGMK
ncbi:MAG: carbohydrate ABC transporter permease [Saccharofermentanales bacterium]